MKQVEALKWLNASMDQLSSSLHPRTWVEKEAQKAPKILLKGGLGNPLRPYHPLMREALRYIEDNPYGNEYGQEGGLLQTKDAAIQFSHDVDGIDLTREQVLVSETGSCPFIGWVAEAMLGQKEYLDKHGMLNALIVTPAYGRHKLGLELRGVNIHEIDPYEGEDIDVSFADALDREIRKHHVKLVVLSSVFNPSTRVMTPSEMAAAVTITQEYGAVLFMDDAYRHVYRRRFTPIQSVLTIPEAINGKVITTLTASKGWQSPTTGGLLLGSPELVSLTTKVRNRKGEGGNIPIQLAWGAMLLDYDYLETTRTAYDEFGTDLVSALNRNGWPEVKESDASIFIRAKVPKSLLERGWTATDFVRELAPLGVIMYPSSFFPGWKKEWVRICMRGERNLIGSAAEVIGEMISNPPTLS